MVKAIYFDGIFAKVYAKIIPFISILIVFWGT